jgi:hypothetical protein
MNQINSFDPCLAVLDEVYEFLNGEMDEVRVLVVRQHLDLCPPCLRQYALEQAVKALLSRSCCQEQAPETLRISIVAQIREIRVTYRTEDLA